jgi:hypothetical protein
VLQQDSFLLCQLGKLFAMAAALLLLYHFVLLAASLAHHSTPSPEEKARSKLQCTPVSAAAATQSSLEKFVASKPKFSDMFEAAAPVNGTANSCPAGFAAANTPSSAYLATGADGSSFFIECLKIKVRLHQCCFKVIQGQRLQGQLDSAMFSSIARGCRARLS